MQNITVICLGKLNAKYFAEGCAEFKKRIVPMAKLAIIELAEQQINEKNASQANIDKALEQEAEKILATVPKGAAIVAMCIEGKQYASEELASFISQRAVGGNGDLAFVIGSSHGLSKKIKDLALVKFSMSKMTFPHQLARLMLLEQLYRALAINANIKYHK